MISLRKTRFCTYYASMVQAFAHNLEERDIKASTRRTAIAVVKSLLSFGHKIGVLPANAGAIVKPPKASVFR